MLHVGDNTWEAMAWWEKAPQFACRPLTSSVPFKLQVARMRLRWLRRLSYQTNRITPPPARPPPLVPLSQVSTTSQLRQLLRTITFVTLSIARVCQWQLVASRISPSRVVPPPACTNPCQHERLANASSPYISVVAGGDNEPATTSPPAPLPNFTPLVFSSSGTTTPSPLQSRVWWWRRQTVHDSILSHLVG
ncbi:hypothetical protein GALMADRAFT_149273 [Galerina marginata CBS 339.88]|uniref:Uncharacterized protein n=1 Tax=Galerina marginata (strain CBS 339.88) TaxID=685588 RepID=A0A067S1Z7_GALM3|nr:hypothetical protein GALMADRAFT_149273 [Galerina marginata CBS 339.88]